MTYHSHLRHSTSCSLRKRQHRYTSRRQPRINTDCRCARKGSRPVLAHSREVGRPPARLVTAACHPATRFVNPASAHRAPRREAAHQGPRRGAGGGGSRASPGRRLGPRRTLVARLWVLIGLAVAGAGGHHDPGGGVGGSVPGPGPPAVTATSMPGMVVTLTVNLTEVVARGTPDVAEPPPRPPRKPAAPSPGRVRYRRRCRRGGRESWRLLMTRSRRVAYYNQHYSIGARIPLPTAVPASTFPSLTTTVPFTRTWRIPNDGSAGCA
jgi:hypothetical protein